jgi:hypothetical protein
MFCELRGEDYLFGYFWPLLLTRLGQLTRKKRFLGALLSRPHQLVKSINCLRVHRHLTFYDLPQALPDDPGVVVETHAAEIVDEPAVLEAVVAEPLLPEAEVFEFAGALAAVEPGALAAELAADAPVVEHGAVPVAAAPVAEFAAVEPVVGFAAAAAGHQIWADRAPASGNSVAPAAEADAAEPWDPADRAPVSGNSFAPAAEADVAELRDPAGRAPASGNSVAPAVVDTSAADCNQVFVDTARVFVPETQSDNPGHPSFFAFPSNCYYASCSSFFEVDCEESAHNPICTRANNGFCSILSILDLHSSRNSGCCRNNPNRDHNSTSDTSGHSISATTIHSRKTGLSRDRDQHRHLVNQEAL